MADLDHPMPCALDRIAGLDVSLSPSIDDAREMGAWYDQGIQVNASTSWIEAVRIARQRRR
jgi:hypothetical protein